MALNGIADVLARQSGQIAVVFCLVWLVSSMMRRASAHWRYMLWMLVLAKCVTLPLVGIPIAVLPDHAQRTSIADVPQTVFNKTADFDETVSQPPMPNLSDISLGSSTQSFNNVVTTTRANSHQTNSGQWLASIWLACIGMILAFVSLRIWVTNDRLCRDRVAAVVDVCWEVENLARELGIRNPPNVYRSSVASQPFVWGLFRGDIYVPSGFAELGTAEQRRAVLTHELAHVARYDAAVNLVQIIVQSLFFFHPLVWWANRQLRHEREKCCDEFVLAATGAEPQLYCDAIVEILASGSSQNGWSPTLAVGGSFRNIEDRIVTALAPDRKFYRRPSLIAVVTIALAAVCLLPTAMILTSPPRSLVAAEPPVKANASDVGGKKEPPAEIKKDVKEDPASTWQAGQVMEFRAIDARTSEPLPDVTLELQNMGPGINFQDVKTQKTDANGISQVKYPDLPVKEARIYPSKPGYVPLRIFWDGEPHVLLPKSITIPMEPGKEFGGTIRNKAGQPIANVEVSIHYWAQGSGKNPHVRANIIEKTTSDTKGRWHLNTMPSDVSARELRIYFKHPDYVSDYQTRGFLPNPVIEQPPLKDLFDQTAVMVMADGEIIEGCVIAAETGLAIPSAKIFLTDSFWLDKPRATSDNEGNFKITGISRDTKNGITRNSNYPLAVVVQATGFAPQLTEIKESSGSLMIKLRVGLSVLGKVVDEAGKPVESASIRATRWKGRNDHLLLSAKSAADGTFTITDAPADVVEYSISHEGYMVAEHLKMSPSSKEQSVTLKSLVQVVGSVVDAETGKPLEKFSFMQGTDYADGRAPSWSPFEMKTSLTGTYATSIKQENFKYRVRVEAEGYLPGESRIIKPYAPDKGQITIDFKLQKAPKLSGVVEGLDEKPLANVEVFLVRGRLNINDRKVTFVEPADRPSIKTDSEGQFEFPPEIETFCLVAVHESGIGMVTDKQFEESPIISIQPWEKQKSQLQIVPRPIPGMYTDFPR